MSIFELILSLAPSIEKDIEEGLSAVHASPNGPAKVAAALPALQKLAIVATQVAAKV